MLTKNELWSKYKYYILMYTEMQQRDKYENAHNLFHSLSVVYDDPSKISGWLLTGLVISPLLLRRQPWQYLNIYRIH